IPNFVTSECPDSLIPEAEHVQSMESYELSALKNALKESKGNRKKAAALLSIGEATLYRKIKRYKL
nr:sigma-54-dependent Fis family transcriptional regulator [Spirochaetia bacterium]